MEQDWTEKHHMIHHDLTIILGLIFHQLLLISSLPLSVWYVWWILVGCTTCPASANVQKYTVTL